MLPLLASVAGLGGGILCQLLAQLVSLSYDVCVLSAGPACYTSYSYWHNIAYLC